MSTHTFVGALPLPEKQCSKTHALFFISIQPLALGLADAWRVHTIGSRQPPRAEPHISLIPVAPCGEDLWDS